MDPKEVVVEAPLTRYLLDKASIQKIPMSGTFELTPMCNFSCRMCYVRKTSAEVQAHSRPLMTLPEWLSIAEKARNMGLLYLLLTGGEPFLWKDFWPLYDRLSDMGLLLTINSNGSLIDERAIARLADKPPLRINITLYGASDETYERLCGVKGVFSKVDRAITGLKEAGVQVKLNCSLTPYNEADMEAMNAYALERGLIWDASAYMFPPVRRDESSVGANDRFTPMEAARCHMRRYRIQYGEEMYGKFLRDVAAGMAIPPGLDESCIDPANGKVRCRAGKAAFWITWDGLMTPCGMMPEPGADLRKLPFEVAWKDIVERSEAIRLSGVCDTCPDKHMCHSCAAMAYTETGSFSGIPKYLCQMTEAMRTLAREELNHLS